MRRIALGAWALIAATFAGAADLRPLANGDSIVGMGVYTGQAADGSLTFSKIGEVAYTLAIDAAGLRRYVDRNGSPFWIYDRNFRRMLFQGRELPPEEQFELLPPEGKIEPGMRWEVPLHQTRAVCGMAEARFTAVATRGPEVTLVVNATPMSVPTVRIDYEAVLRCGQRDSFLRTMDVLFSPALHEIVHMNTVNYDGVERGPLKLGDQGRGWRLQSISMAP